MSAPTIRSERTGTDWYDSQVPKLPTKPQAPPADLRSGMVSDPGARAVGHQGARVSHRVGAGGVAGQGQGSFSALRCSTLTPVPGLLRDKLADATGYPLLPPPACVKPIHGVLLAC